MKKIQSIIPKKNKEELKDVKKGNKGSTLAFFILLLVVFGFIAPNFDSIINPLAPKFGSYNGKNIEYTENSFFVQNIGYTRSQLEAQYKQQFGESFSIDWLPQELIIKQAFDRTVQQIGLEEQAKMAGIYISKKEVQKNILKQNQFLDAQGQFSIALYNQMNNAQKQSLEKTIYTNLLNETYQSDLMLTLPNKKLFSNLLETAKYQRNFEIISFDEKDLPSDFLINYAEKNALKFTSKDFLRIAVKTQAEAQAIMDELAKGEKSFENLATEKSLDETANSEGKLNASYYYELIKDIKAEDDVKKLFALPFASTSIIEGINNFYVYKANSEPKDFIFEENESLVLNYLKEEDKSFYEETLENIVLSFKEKVKTSTFAEQALALNKEVQTLGPIALNYGGLYGLPSISQLDENKILGNLENQEDFWINIFKLKPQEISDVFFTETAMIVLSYKEEYIDDALDGKQFGLFTNYFINQEKSIALEKSFTEADPLFKNNYEEAYKSIFTANN